MTKKKMILGAAITAAAILAVAGVTNSGQKTLETAVVSSEPQEQATVEDKIEPIPEMVTLDEPEQAEILTSRLQIEIEPPIEAVNETFTVDEPEIEAEEQAPEIVDKQPYEDEQEIEAIEILDEPQEIQQETPAELPKTAPAQSQEPNYGDRKDGYIYVRGFGWIPEIPPGEGTFDAEMYCNGNKIGTFG